MTGIVFAGIMPHGFPLIPEMSEDAGGALATRAAMEELGRRCAATQPEVLVLATPHGVRVDGAIALAGVARAAGTLRWDGKAVEMNVAVDAPLTDRIVQAMGTEAVPAALVSFGGNRRDQSVLPLDWGALIPLWFLGHDRNMLGYGDVLSETPSEEIGPPVVLAAPSRLLPRSAMVAFGRSVAEAAKADGRRVAFIASCDWGHTHAASGPYGYHPAAAEVDQLVVAALREQQPGRLIDLPQQQVQDAAIDGLWQTLMLAGVMEQVPLQGEVLSYEAPSYYGMIVASFTPA